MSLLSWGENIKVKVTEEEENLVSVRIGSAAKFGSEIVALPRHMENVRTFFEVVSSELAIPDVEAESRQRIEEDYLTEMLRGIVTSRSSHPKYDKSAEVEDLDQEAVAQGAVITNKNHFTRLRQTLGDQIALALWPIEGITSSGLLCLTQSQIIYIHKKGVDVSKGIGTAVLTGLRALADELADTYTIDLESIVSVDRHLKDGMRNQLVICTTSEKYEINLNYVDVVVAEEVIEKAVSERIDRQAGGSTAQLIQLGEMFEKGLLTKEEFEAQKATLITGSNS